MQRRILILFAHPAFQKSRAQRQLLDVVRDLDAVTVNDLYEQYPDFNVDVAREQSLLLEHDVVVFQHPFYWYSSPAILKEWQDLVLEYGFAYGHGGTALAGKIALTAISSGGGFDAYSEKGFNRFTIRQFLVPFEQTARLCGMTYLPPFVAHGLHRNPDPETMEIFAAAYHGLLVSLRDDTLDMKRVADCAYLNEATRFVAGGEMPERHA